MGRAIGATLGARQSASCFGSLVRAPVSVCIVRRPERGAAPRSVALDATVDTLTDEYEDARKLAMATGQPSAAVSATTGKARIHGLDKGEGGTDEGDPINIQINFTDTK